jgi:hypothetical protein
MASLQMEQLMDMIKMLTPLGVKHTNIVIDTPPQAFLEIEIHRQVLQARARLHVFASVCVYVCVCVCVCV